MKRLLKLCIVAVVLVLGASSCLKENDSVNMSYQSNSVYILQTETGKFIPQMRLFGEMLASASLNVEGKSFNFTSLNGYAWELTNSHYSPLPELDSVTQGFYTLTAKREDGKIGNLHVGFNAVNKKIGNISSSLEHLSDKRELSVKLDSLVKNAKEYYLMIKVPVSKETSSAYAMWLPYKSLDKIEKEVLTETISCSNWEAGTYKIAVAAGYGSLLRIAENSIEITIKAEQ